MRNYAKETAARVEYIRAYLRESGARGIVFGNSGGKDSALVGILCKLACEDTVGIIMPCASKRNYGMDRDDGMEVAEKFHIETRTVDLTPVREAELAALEKHILSAPVPANVFKTARIGGRDRIIPAAAQRSFWSGEAVSIIEEPEAPHFPFRNIHSFEELIDAGRNR